MEAGVEMKTGKIHLSDSLGLLFLPTKYYPGEVFGCPIFDSDPLDCYDDPKGLIKPRHLFKPIWVKTDENCKVSSVKLYRGDLTMVFYELATKMLKYPEHYAGLVSDPEDVCPRRKPTPLEWWLHSTRLWLKFWFKVYILRTPGEIKTNEEIKLVRQLYPRG